MLRMDARPYALCNFFDACTYKTPTLDGTLFPFPFRWTLHFTYAFYLVTKT